MAFEFEEAKPHGPLPAWADKFLGGHIEQYAQLSTRDGRLTGNAVVLGIHEETILDVTQRFFTVLTDFGNVIQLSEFQVERQFYPPQWRMKEKLALYRRYSMSVYLNIERGVLLGVGNESC